jgi:hypothetical protein
MFVSVVRGDSRQREIYECDGVQIQNSSNDEFDIMSLQLWLGREKPKDFWVEVNKMDGSEVYIMNNEGKTIDTYRWAWIENPKPCRGNKNINGSKDNAKR